MNVYTFSYWSGRERGFFQVVAAREERARELLANDGHNLVCFDCETVIETTPDNYESIVFSMVFED